MFSKRELEVCSLLIKGFKNKEIGKKLGISEKRVSSNKLSIKEKLTIEGEKNDFFIVKQMLVYFNELDVIDKTILLHDYKINVLHSQEIIFKE